MNPSTDRLHEFVAVVDAGSISAAARALGLPRATLSRRLSGLEDELGVRLLHRETRRLVLTHAGEQLIGRARRLVEASTEAWQAVRRLDDTPRGRLRVSVPPSGLLHRALVDFAAAHPAIELQVVATPRHVDLIAEGVDVALRFGAALDPGLIARRLWADRLSVAASPGWLDRRGRPDAPADLAGCPGVVGFAEGGRPRSTWPLRGGGAIDVAGHFVSNDLSLRLQAALAGLGPALLPDPLTAPYRATGQLERVLPEQVGATTAVTLVYVERAFLLPQVRAFIDHTVAAYADGIPLEPAALAGLSTATRSG